MNSPLQTPEQPLTLRFMSGPAVFQAPLLLAALGGLVALLSIAAPLEVAQEALESAPAQLRLAYSAGIGLVFASGGVLWLAVATLLSILLLETWLREDTIRVEKNAHKVALIVDKRAGVFRHCLRFERAEIRQIVVAFGNVLWLHANDRSIVLSQHGTRRESLAAAEKLRAALGLPPPAADPYPAALPPGWALRSTANGIMLLVRERAATETIYLRCLAAALFAIILLVAALAFMLLTLWLTDTRRVDPLPAAILAILCAAGGLWMYIRGSASAVQLRLAPEGLHWERRLGRQIVDRALISELHLSVEIGDDQRIASFDLTLRGTTSSASLARTHGDRLRRIAFYNSADPTGPRCLGRWLASKGTLPMIDTRPELVLPTWDSFGLPLSDSNLGKH